MTSSSECVAVDREALAEGTRSAPAGSRILLAEDDPLLLRAYERALREVGFLVDRADNGEDAVNLVLANAYDAVVTDINLPGVDGVSVLQAAQKCDPDVPVVLITGDPRVDTAIAAVEHAAFRYLSKPLSIDVLQTTAVLSAQAHRVLVLRRMAVDLASATWSPAEDRRSLRQLFERALQSVRMDYQPIVSCAKKQVVSFEALLRSAEPTMANPCVFLSAAERLGRMAELGRIVRDRVAAEVSRAPARSVFVNLHSGDLLDEHLYDPGSALSRIADRVVLEVTERAALASIADIAPRVARLRTMGFRIALDNFGAGHSDLQTFIVLQPEIIKYDMSLVRGIDSSPTRCKVVSTMTALFAEMDVQMVAAGVETDSECSTLVGLGIDRMQGFLFARPAPMSNHLSNP